MDFSNYNFTDREQEIFHLLTQGKSSMQIAKDLSISRHTVDTHRRKILKKAKLKTTIELVSIFFNGRG